VTLQVLRDHFESYGPINQWAPIGAFGRIVVVYEDEDDAERAKVESDPVTIDPTPERDGLMLRVYRADPNPLISKSGSGIPSSFYLAPPAIEKNFLISPPGSPPVGWEPIKEDPPNSAPLAVDLMEALRKLHLRQGGGRTLDERGWEVLIEPEDGGVGVYVEDCGGDDEEVWREQECDWAYGESSPRTWKPVATALPPMPAATAVM